MDITDLIKEINILDVKPHQTLLVKLKFNIDQEGLEQLKQQFKNSLKCNVLICSDNMEFSVIDTDEDTDN